jgi:hypothetical protein
VNTTQTFFRAVTPDVRGIISARDVVEQRQQAVCPRSDGYRHLDGEWTSARAGTATNRDLRNLLEAFATSKSKRFDLTRETGSASIYDCCLISWLTDRSEVLGGVGDQPTRLEISAPVSLWLGDSVIQSSRSL